MLWFAQFLAAATDLKGAFAHIISGYMVWDSHLTSRGMNLKSFPISTDAFLYPFPLPFTSLNFWIGAITCKQQNWKSPGRTAELDIDYHNSCQEDMVDRREFEQVRIWVVP